MPVQINNSKISAHLDLATYPIQISYDNKIFYVKQGNLRLSHVLKDGLLGKDLAITSKRSKLKILH